MARKAQIPGGLIAIDPDGNAVAYDEDFNATMDASGRFPVGPDHWTISVENPATARCWVSGCKGHAQWMVINQFGTDRHPHPMCDGCRPKVEIPGNRWYRLYPVI